MFGKEKKERISMERGGVCKRGYVGEGFKCAMKRIKGKEGRGGVCGCGCVG